MSLSNITAEEYQKDCTDFFAPLDEIAEALNNDEGICGIGHFELVNMIQMNKEMKQRLIKYL